MNGMTMRVGQVFQLFVRRRKRTSSSQSASSNTARRVAIWEHDIGNCVSYIRNALAMVCQNRDPAVRQVVAEVMACCGRITGALDVAYVLCREIDDDEEWEGLTLDDVRQIVCETSMTCIPAFRVSVEWVGLTTQRSATVAVSYRALRAAMFMLFRIAGYGARTVNVGHSIDGLRFLVAGEFLIPSELSGRPLNGQDLEVSGWDVQLGGNLSGIVSAVERYGGLVTVLRHGEGVVVSLEFKVRSDYPRSHV